MWRALVRGRPDARALAAAALRGELAEKQSADLAIAARKPSAYNEIVNAHALDFEPIVIEHAGIS